MNIMIPLQQIIISMKDVIGKVQGTMTASLFTLLGSYYALKSLMGAIAQLIIIILIALAVTIAILWILPFTWGAAISMTAVFVAISIPMIIIIVFLVDVLKVQTSLSVPTLSIPSVKCFDKNTLIEMNDGTKKKIIDIINHKNMIGYTIWHVLLGVITVMVSTNSTISSNCGFNS